MHLWKLIFLGSLIALSSSSATDSNIGRVFAYVRLPLKNFAITKQDALFVRFRLIAYCLISLRRKS